MGSARACVASKVIRVRDSSDAIFCALLGPVGSGVDSAGFEIERTQ